MASDDDVFAARLFVQADLSPGESLTLDEAQTHYLRAVLRLGPGDKLALINGRDGEALAVVEKLDKRSGLARIEKLTRPFAPEPDLWLCFAPIKRARLDMMVEKATELGASRLIPTLTRRTNAGRVTTERLRAIAQEATEQCERLTLPEVAEPIPLTKLLADWPQDRMLLMADEAGDAPDALSALAGLPSGTKLAVLIGPEGGFDPNEREALKALAIRGEPRHGEGEVNGVSLSDSDGSGFVLRVSLGPRILRADTAAMALLALVQAQQGDWRNLGPRGSELASHEKPPAF
ncbi:MAG: 16S rRNA (uracil(1498)-N(3))-methyltransferase [Elstera sp.]